MNFTANTHALIQIGLLGFQILLPAFVSMTHGQEVAVSGFVSAVQGVLGWSAIHTMPDGTPVSKEK